MSIVWLNGKMILLILGFLLDKKVGVNQPKRIENAKILIANTPMDTDKIKVWKVRFESTYTSPESSGLC